MVVVIACVLGLIIIIGILAAIAVPNFIAYRNKAYCYQAETDAKNVLNVLEEYYADPAHKEIPTITELKENYGLTLYNSDIRITGELPDLCVEVADSSGRCPRGERYTECLESPARWE